MSDEAGDILTLSSAKKGKKGSEMSPKKAAISEMGKQEKVEKRNDETLLACLIKHSLGEIVVSR